MLEEGRIGMVFRKSYFFKFGVAAFAVSPKMREQEGQEMGLVHVGLSATEIIK
jgi:hypothetical protein